MLTIATGTFTAIDLADAAIRGALKSGGNAAVFATNFLLRVNFVGVGRFAVAVFFDVKMGIQRSSLRNERMAIYSEQLHLLNAKIFYSQANMWITAENTEQAIEEAYEAMEKSVQYFLLSIENTNEILKHHGEFIKAIEVGNPELKKKIDDILLI